MNDAERRAGQGADGAPTVGQDELLPARANNVAGSVGGDARSVAVRFGFSGERGVNFGTIVSNQLRYSIALDGWLAVDPETGNILFTGLHEGVLASFRPDGRTNYIVKTIDPVPLPPVRVTPTGLMTLSDGGQAAALSLSVDDGTAFVLAAAHPHTGAVPLVDEYNVRDGSYLASFPAPETCHQAIARGRKLYTMSGIGVTVWRGGSS